MRGYSILRWLRRTSSICPGTRIWRNVLTPSWPDLARLGRLQDTLAGVLLPRLLVLNQEHLGTVLDNLNRAERLEWIRSAADWVELRRLRNRMVHEYVEDAQQLADALNAAHAAIPDIVAAAAKLADLAAQLGR